MSLLYQYSVSTKYLQKDFSQTMPAQVGSEGAKEEIRFTTEDAEFHGGMKRRPVHVTVAFSVENEGKA